MTAADCFGIADDNNILYVSNGTDLYILNPTVSDINKSITLNLKKVCSASPYVVKAITNVRKIGNTPIKYQADVLVYNKVDSKLSITSVIMDSLGSMSCSTYTINIFSFPDASLLSDVGNNNAKGEKFYSIALKNDNYYILAGCSLYSVGQVTGSATRSLSLLRSAATTIAISMCPMNTAYVFTSLTVGPDDVLRAIGVSPTGDASIWPLIYINTKGKAESTYTRYDQAPKMLPAASLKVAGLINTFPVAALWVQTIISIPIGSYLSDVSIIYNLYL